MSWQHWRTFRTSKPRSFIASSFVGMVLATSFVLAGISPAEAGSAKTEVIESGPFKITVTNKVDDYDFVPHVAVALSGTAIAMVRLDGTVGKPEVTTAELDAGNAFPEIVITGYSGGAHCCTTVKVVTSVGQSSDKAWKIVDLGEFDGRVETPRDLDGDGQTEFLLKDDRFLYAYGCYACSYAPPLILSIRKGRRVDLTSSPPMHSLLVEEARRLEKFFRKAQQRKERIENGMLAGYVALKIRIGEGVDGWKRMLALHQRRERYEYCPVPARDPYEDCPVRMLRLSFPLHLSIFLRETDYIVR